MKGKCFPLSYEVGPNIQFKFIFPPQQTPCIPHGIFLMLKKILNKRMEKSFTNKMRCIYRASEI